MEKLLKELITDWNIRIKKLGLTRKRFCADANIAYHTYRKLKNPTFKTLEKIESHLRFLEGK